MLFSDRIFLSPAQCRLFERGVPVLMYHKIAAPPPVSCDPFLYVAPDQFQDQLAALRGAGFTPVKLDEALAAPDNRAKKLVLTFDDGCRNVLDNALEILSRHRAPAIQFLVADFIGKHNQWDVVNKGDVA